MARGPIHRGSLRSKEEQLAARAVAVAKITELLQEEPRTVGELHLAVGGMRPTLFSYLRHMHKTLRKIHMTSQKRNGAILWALGEDRTLPSPDEELDQLFAVKRGSGPAQQIGLRRDPLVAALFGPAAMKEAA